MKTQRLQSLRNRAWFLAAVLMLGSAAHGWADDLFLAGGRFRVSATFQTAAGPGPGSAQGVPLSDDSGTFWFFSPANVELVVKVIDACAPPFERFWFFAAGLTNVAVEIEVEDVFAGGTRRYSNAAGHAFEPIQDTAAFATCGFERACGQGTAAEIAATPRADASLESLALVLSNGVTARQATYDRLVDDLAAIKADFPEVADIGFHLRYDPSTLLLTLTPEAVAAANAGTYHEWDCLNSWYDASEVRLLGPLNVATVHFRGRLRTDRLIAEYAALDGVLAAAQNFLAPPPIPPAPLNNLCAFVEGERFHYLFPFGHDGYWYLTTAGPGAEPVFEDQYFHFPVTQPPPPAWFGLFDSCRQQQLGS
ncbi:MAG TPA: hypothetical protein VEG34_19065 [Thermoanaerobaculia bacterium]|nr:hypothetical protein [Thermoanaerobaculia bacterium]